MNRRSHQLAGVRLAYAAPTADRVALRLPDALPGLHLASYRYHAARRDRRLP